MNQDSDHQKAPAASLRAEGITCVRGERCLYEGLCFEAEPGAVLRLAGPNGAGKTTLMRIVAGLLTPTEGKIFWGGRDTKELGGDFRADLLYIGHLNGVKEELTCLENLRTNATLFGREASREACLDALKQVGLRGFEEEPVRFLSQGQHRRASLSRLYLSEDIPLWILDEPFTALDVKGVASLCRLIERHAASGGITLMTTHQESGLSTPGYRELDVSDFSPARRRARTNPAVTPA